MKPKRKRRAGATATIGVSLDPETKRKLKALAAAKHDGNVSALIAEMTEDALRQAAFETAWRWYGGTDLSDEAREALDAEMNEGWAHARKHARRRSRGKTAA